MDWCSLTKGCQHDWMPGCEAGWEICSLSGQKGDTVDCPLDLVRSGPDVPLLAGMDLKLDWDGDIAELSDLFDKQCIGTSCYPISLVNCNGSNTSCTTKTLQPSGHELLVVPGQKSDWYDRVSIVAYHGSVPGTGFQEAYLLPSAGDEITPSVDPNILILRFQLLKDIPAENAGSVRVQMLEANPVTGEPFGVKMVDGATGPIFVVGSP